MAATAASRSPFDSNGDFVSFDFLFHDGPLPAACDAIIAALS